MSLLTKIHKKLYPDSLTRIDEIPVVTLGGKGRFEEALGTARLFFEETEAQIKTICILDRDYATDEEIEKYYDRATASNLKLHVWKKKEIENYIVTPEIIFAASKLPISEKENLFKLLDSKLDELKDEVVDQIAERMHQLDKSKSFKTVSQQARSYVAKKWNELSEKMSLVNGKDLVKSVASLLKEKYNINLRKRDLLDAITVDNVSSEIIDVLRLLTENV